VEPLGHFERLVPPWPGLAIGAGAIFAATGLLELSRTLAETFRGRWFAGNGRDLFHGLAGFTAAGAFFVNGLPAALACLWAFSSVLVPLLVLDGLPARRSARTGLLFALIACAALPALLQPEAIVSTANSLTRLLF
jgi:hypothetical protein